MTTGKEGIPDNNLNEDGVEPFKNLAFAMKDQNVNIKLLRALRSHEKRIVRLEKILEARMTEKERIDVE